MFDLYLGATLRCSPPFRTAIEGAVCAKPLGTPNRLFGESGVVSAIGELLVFAVGALAVLVLIYGGVLLVMSGGNREKADRAKRTIIMALVGVVVAALAYAIVRFVLVSLLG